MIISLSSTHGQIVDAMFPDSIFIPILALNVHKDIWGDDALEFR